MHTTQLCTIFLICLLYVDNVSPFKKRKKRPVRTTKPTTTPKPAWTGWRDLQTTLLERYIFEGIDYQDPFLPEPFKKQEMDCQGQYIKCVLITPTPATACAYDSLSSSYGTYFHPCVIDLLNCINRETRYYWIKGGGAQSNYWHIDPPYGTSTRQTRYWYDGDGTLCAKTRRFENTFNISNVINNIVKYVTKA